MPTIAACRKIKTKDAPRSSTRLFWSTKKRTVPNIRDKVEEKVLCELDVAIERLTALAKAKIAPKPVELAEISALRKRALAYRDRFADVVGQDYDRIESRLNDFERAFAAALAAGQEESP